MQHLDHSSARPKTTAGVGAASALMSPRFHSTPDPDSEPPAPNPNPDDVPPPAHAPVQEPPSSTEPPIKAE